jgi:hypothetical protein
VQYSTYLLLWLLASIIYRRRTTLGRFIQPVARPTLQLALIRAASSSLP